MKRTSYLHNLKTIVVAGLAMLAGCDYGKFKDQPSLRPYEIELPEMPAGAIPLTGGAQILREMDEKDIQNPVSYSPDSVARGEVCYGYFCIMCHGANADGNGTVGQSFSPLPANLKEPPVQHQNDGALFYKITFGFKRHPPLAQTVAEPDRWDIINYLRSLSRERVSFDNQRIGN